MEFYYYVNIFETKGLEYLLLLSFLALFIFLVRYLSSSGKSDAVSGERRRQRPAEEPAPLRIAD